MVSYIREIQMCCVQKWQMQPEWKTFLLGFALELQISSVGKFAVQQTKASTLIIARQTVDPSLGFVSPVSGVAAPSRFPLLHAGKIFFPLNQEKPRAKEESIIQRFISPASSRSTEKEQKMKMNIFPNVTALIKLFQAGASGGAMAFCPSGPGSNPGSTLVFSRFWQSLYLAFYNCGVLEQSHTLTFFFPVSFYHGSERKKSKNSWESLEGRRWHSTEVAFAFFSQLPWVWISALPRFITRHCLVRGPL